MPTDSKAMHTPGPWTIDPEGLVAVSIEGAGGYIVCDVYGASNDPLGNANARLIAAAPELLKALQEIERNAPTNPIVLRIARAAIARATEGK